MADVEVRSLKRSQAESISAALAGVPGVESVALFGSVARGTDATSSDIDLLVLVGDASASPSHLEHQLPPALWADGLTLTVFTHDRLRRYLRDWSRFAVHLRQESVVLFDTHDALTKLLAASSVVSVTHELQAQRSNLKQYEQLTRFGGRLLFPLAHLYRIGRTTILASLASRAIFEFDSDRAFRQLAELAPTLAFDIAIISQLRPFHISVRAQERAQELPFDPNSPEALQWAVEAREAIERLLDDACRDV